MLFLFYDMLVGRISAVIRLGGLTVVVIVLIVLCVRLVACREACMKLGEMPCVMALTLDRSRVLSGMRHAVRLLMTPMIGIPFPCVPRRPVSLPLSL